MTGHGTLKGHRVGRGNDTQGEIPKDLHPRQQVNYRCPDGHKTVLTFAADADELPATWDCSRCGKTSRREGVPADTPVTEQLPKYGVTNGPPRKDPKTPREHLFERRTPAELDLILAEAITALRDDRP